MPHIAHAHLATNEQASAVSTDARTYVAFALTALLAGGNAVAVKIANQELAPFWNAAIRFLAAAVILMVVVAALRLSLPRGRAPRWPR